MKTETLLQMGSPIPLPDGKKIRHEISTGLSFVETSVRNLSGHRPNLPQALKLYAIGSGRLRALLSTLDELPQNVFDAKTLGYNATKDGLYTPEHPDVIAWTRQFEQRATEKGIFTTLIATHPAPSIKKAITVGALWHRFSEFMPWFLCQASAMVSTNEKRHYVMQTAFEELGMRDAAEIHADMFWSAANLAGATISDRDRIRLQSTPTSVLERLRTYLFESHSDSEILGLLLGLEIPAIENIETLLASLSHNSDLGEKLAAHKFFRLHRQIEIEHVRLTVANFLRFCGTEDERALFIRGFDKGLEFWLQFWTSAAAAISTELAKGVQSA